MASKKLNVLRHYDSSPFFFNIWKKLKFVEWFSWCNTPCLWEESKFSSFFKNRIFNSRKHSALRVSFICCMRWPTVAHWLARDGWFAETAGVLLPKPPGQWIQILCTYTNTKRQSTSQTPRSMDTNIMYLRIQNGKVLPKTIDQCQVFIQPKVRTSRWCISIKFSSKSPKCFPKPF